MSYAAAGLFSFIPVLVFVTGVIIALVTRRKHPRRSTLAAIGFAVLAVAGILQTGWNVAGFQLRVANHWSIDVYAAYSGGIGVLDLLLVIAAWVLILLALFVADDKTPTTPAQVPQPPPFPGQRPTAH